MNIKLRALIYSIAIVAAGIVGFVGLATVLQQVPREWEFPIMLGLMILVTLWFVYLTMVNHLQYKQSQKSNT